MAYHPDSRTITVGENFDFIADTGLHFIHTYREMAQKEDASESIRNDWGLLEEWLGCAGRELTPADDLRIRTAWLGYFAVGLAPSFGLQPAFDLFASTHDAKALLKDKPPTHIMDVFDRMQATDDEIAKKRSHDIEAEKDKFKAILSKKSQTSLPSDSGIPKWLEDPKILHKIVFGAMLAAWLLWVGSESDGFSGVHPAGWLVIVSVPLAVYFALPPLFGFLRRSGRDVRFVFSANVMWVFLIGTLSYVWEWNYSLSTEQLIALFILPPIGSWIALFLWKWSSSKQ